MRYRGVVRHVRAQPDVEEHTSRWKMSSYGEEEDTGAAADDSGASAEDADG